MLAFLIILSCNILVNLLSLYETWIFLGSINDWIQLPKIKREEFIFFASSNLSFLALVLFTLSLQDLGIITFFSLLKKSLTIVYVFPVPVWPYENIVYENIV